MLRGRFRPWAAWFLLVFCAGTLFSPHRHLNPTEDLLSDGPSDSGVVLLVHTPIAPGEGPLWREAAFLDDDPCLACFWHDTTAAVVPVIPLSAASGMLAIAVIQGPAAPRIEPLSPPPSRGPPLARPFGTRNHF